MWLIIVPFIWLDYNKDLTLGLGNIDEYLIRCYYLAQFITIHPISAPGGNHEY